MSDLHCPATLLLARPADVAPLLEPLRPRGVARVWSGPADRGPAAAAAAALGVDAAVVDGLAPLPAGREALQEIADLHRGETVLVLVDGAAGEGEVVEVPVDGDGFGLAQKSRVVVSSIPRNAS